MPSSIVTNQASRRQPTLKGRLGLYTLAGQARPDLMHIQWSKLDLRASLPKRIRRALVSVMDNHVDSTVVAVRGVVAAKIGVPLDGKYMWVFDKVCLKLFAAPQKKRRPRKRFVLKVSRQHSKQLSEQ